MRYGDEEERPAGTTTQGRVWPPSRPSNTLEVLNQEKPTGYTTTLKIMQLMAEKGLLLRDDSQFRHVFRPAISEEKTQKQVVSSLVDRAFAGSAAKLVVRALSARKIPDEELARIREMIDEMGGGGVIRRRSGCGMRNA